MFISTSGTGSISVPFVMPAGTELWVQWGIQDAAALVGVALSNAILVLTP